MVKANLVNGQSPLVNFEIQGAKKSGLDISFLVYNKQKRQWERKNLKAGPMVLQALHSLNNQTGRISDILKREGAVVKLKRGGVYYQDSSNREVNLLDDYGYFSSTRKTIQKTLAAVTDLLKTKYVVIELHVVSDGERLKECVTQSAEIEAKCLEKIGKACEALGDTQWANYLSERRLSPDHIQLMREKLKALYEAKKDVVDLMNAVNDRLENKAFQEAVEIYKDRMSRAQERYFHAVREWEIEQEVLNQTIERKEAKDIFLFDFQKHVSLQVRVARSLFLYAKESLGSEKMDTTESLKKIEACSISYLNNKSFVSFCRQEFRPLFKQEIEFNKDVAEALAAFEDAKFTDWLEAEGFTEAEVEEHKKKLSHLKTVSERVLRVLQNTDDHITRGDINKGMQVYAEQINMPEYHNALKDLIIPQRVAVNRLEGLQAFSLDFKRVESHLDCLTSIADKEKELQLTGDYKIEWKVDFPALKEEKVDYDQAAKFQPLSDAFNTRQQKLRNFLEAFGYFVENYQHNRVYFEALMRQEGFTELETAALFSPYVSTYPALQRWYEGQQVTADLANRKDYKGALEQYSRIVNSEFLELNWSITNFIPYIDRFHDEKIEGVIKRFVEDIGVPNRDYFCRNLGVAHYISRLEMQINEVKNQIKAAGIEEESETFKAAYTLVTEQTLKNNAIVDHMTRLYEPDGQFKRFFNRRNGPVTDRSWAKILRKEGWNTREVLAFDEVFDQYAKLIQPLKDGEDAVAFEQDPLKKRALRFQLVQLGIQLRPQLRRLAQKFEKLGGYQRLEALVQATIKLSSTLFSKEIRNEAKALCELIRHRREYVDKFYARHHFKVLWEPNSIVKVLFGGPQVSDPVYKEYLAEQGWSVRDIRELNRNYDAYQKAVHPLLLAKARLAEDPENILLQQNFRKVYAEQIGKINRLFSDFDLQKIKDLEWGIAKYLQRLSKAAKEVDDERLGELKRSMKTLSQFKLSTEIGTMHKQVQEISGFSKRKMSWERGYLGDLIAENSLLTDALKPHKKDLDRFFGKYQDHLQKVNELERKLEAVPEQSSFQKDLKKELHAHAEQLTILESLRERVEDKIFSPITKLKAEMERQLKYVQKTESYRDAAHPEVKETMEKQVTLDRKRHLGGRSNLEAEAYIQQCEQLKAAVKEAFQEKIRFMQNVYKRYGLK